MRFFFTLFFSLFIFVGCTTPNVPTTDAGENYLPLETGRYIIYDVTEQRFSTTASPSINTYQLKETTGNAYTDVTGQPAYRIQRYRRASAQAAWQTDSLWTARTNSRMAVRTENGADFVKLVFPATERIRWNGNQLNSFGEDTYELLNTGQPYFVNSQAFAETVTVVEQNDSTLVSQDRRVAVYARRVGLIYRETVQLQFCQATPACVGKGQVDSGVRRFVRVVSYGKD